ncbi:MAG: cytidylate kinase family protein, partial [Lachnospiraceae bacterium]|nr:cytidylate kinase family protein [Lachnospiraceae bacterium]
MNTLITIGRQFGSGGREIGERVAKHFGIPCYDNELLSKAA